jgi:hypothetical protein
MKRLATATALLTLLGAGAALAQGAPPGSAWHSGWPAYVQQQQAELNARNAPPANPDHQTASTRRNRTRTDKPAPFASETADNRLAD